MSTPKLLQILFIICIVLTSLSCHNNDVNKTIIQGEIESDIHSFKLTSSRLDYQFSKQIIKDSKGYFSDTLHLNEGLYYLDDGTNGYIPLYLEPNKKYNIKYKASDFISNGIFIHGDDADINKYFIEKRRQRIFYNPYGDGKTESEFRDFLNEIRSNQEENLLKSNLSSSLKEFEKKAIHYNYLKYLNLYLILNDIESPTIASKKELKIDFENENDFRLFGDYRSLVGDYFNQKLIEKEKRCQKIDSNYNRNTTAIKDIDSLISNNFIKNKIIENNGLYTLKYSSDINNTFNDFKRLYTGSDSVFIKEMQDLYESFVHYQNGVTSPKFVDFINYNGGSNSLDDFKGKFVYIDFWASWCGNCLVQLPYLKKLEENYADKNIAFISISREEESKWRNSIKKNDMKGIQLLATNDDFHNAFAVFGIPRYILINPEGEIVNHNAPRPSEKEIIELFNKYID